MEVNQKQLSKLIQDAMQNESQVEFAQKCGISKWHLNRMLSGKLQSIPSKTTLQKIADNSTAELGDLLAACGYGDIDFKVSVADVARRNAKCILDGFSQMTRNAKLYPSTRTFMEELFLIYDQKKMTCKLGKPEEYEGSEHKHAEYYQKGCVEFYTSGRLVTIWFVLYFCQTKGGQIVMVDAAMDGKTLMEHNVIDPQVADILYEDGTDINLLPYYFEIRKDLRAEERLLKAIFGSGGKMEEIVVTEIGYGFEVKELPKNFVQFLVAHKKTALLPGIMADDVTKAEAMFFNITALEVDPVDELKDCENRCTGEQGFAAVIANIMREETGISFCMWNSLNDGTPIVMIEEEHEDMEEILPIIHEYAKELGIKQYGECIAYVKYLKDPSLQFMTEEN